MIRATAVVVAILLVPAISEAQQPGAGERTHVVESGETLDAIAREYLGSASDWRVIFEANRDRIQNPDRIEVGMTLTIPGVDTGDGGPSRVTAVQVGGPERPPQDLDSYETRRELLESSRFEPSGVPEVPVSTRTVFYDMPTPADEVSMVVFQSPELAPALPPGVFQAAGWLIPPGESDASLGEIEALTVDQVVGPGRDALQLHEMVQLRFDAQGRPQVGDEFLVYTSRAIEDLGRVAAPTGLVRVEQVGEEGAVAQVVDGFGPLRVGHRLARPRTFPLEVGVHPIESDVRIEGRVLAFQQSKELHIPGDYAIIDVGSGAGLAIGDEMIGLAEDADDWTGRELARFQVVGLQGEYATVVIVQVRNPVAVRPGLRLVTDRKMP
ncbi:MAG: LysM peptidoglycan-binding domain-containing protein [Gemmatimonadota bacterium]